MSQCILILTDDLDHSSKWVAKLQSRFFIEIVNLFELQASYANQEEPAVVVVDVNLSSAEAITHLKKLLTQNYANQSKIFLIDPSKETSEVQADALGATRCFTVQKDVSPLETCLKRYVHTRNAGLGKDAPIIKQQAFKSVEKVNDSIFRAISEGKPLPKKELSNTSNLIISSLEGENVFSWLDAVKEHHSYTHRHCMTVTGLAVAFGQHYNMDPENLQTLATGALVHDIGKVKIPLNILDKPGPLTEEERTEIEKHPIYSYEILVKDSQFDEKVIGLARHHHEYLDGSGYPDGLSGDEINDLVRIMTIIDIFSALVDQRAYKSGMPNDKAYKILLSMEDKLDNDFLKAFEPIALGTTSEDTQSFAKKVKVL